MGFQDELWKNNQPGLEKYGHTMEEVTKAAAGWYGDDTGKAVSPFMPAVNILLPEHTGMGNIDKQYVNEDDITSGAWQDKIQKVGNLDKTEDRLKLLDVMTQQASGFAGGDMMSGGNCGAQVLVAAAIKGGGSKGIQAILDEVKKGRDPRDRESLNKMLFMQSQLDKGNLTTEDLDMLTSELNGQLRLKQKALDDAETRKDPNHEVSRTGVSPEVLKGFIQGSEQMTSYFKDGKMSIDSVDTDGVKGANHFVLSMGGTNGIVYDPYARKDGHQLIFNPLEVKNYHNAEDRGDRLDASSVGGTPHDGLY